jgi:DNA polymerase III subunit epsilon
MDHVIDGGGAAADTTDWTVDEFAPATALEAPAAPLAAPASPNQTAREKLYAFLESRPAGANAVELAGLLFKGAASDPELNARLIHGLIGADPNFVFEASTGFWSLRRSANLRIPLDEARFVVVDLETTGGRPAPGSIIEIGAYRVEGRRLTESFQSIVRPLMRIPRFIEGLTSITNEMVLGAPPIEEVLPAFRDFLGDAVMVAHNAQFDHSFLDFEFRRLFGIGITNPLLCTIRLSRRLLPSLKRRRLDALAEHFGLSTEGRHRGLGDARMAAELLTIFLDMAPRMGTTRLDRLLDWQHRGTSGRRLERHVPPEVVNALPRTPGVYVMHNERGDVLYVGKAARLRDRVASYFNGGISLNAKTAELISHVYTINTIHAGSALEAALTEARMIRDLKPPYNRMLKSMAPAFFVKLNLNDPFPRIQLTQKLGLRAGVMYLGPFIGRRNLDYSVRVLSRLMGLRTCSGKLAPDPDFSPCIYGQIGHCAAPCNGSISEDGYGDRVRRAIGFMRGRVGAVMGELAQARDLAATAMRFEEANRHQRELRALSAFADRMSRLSRAITENNLVIVIRPCSAPVMNDAGDDPAGTATPDHRRIVYVVLGGRLALTRQCETRETSVLEQADQIARFIADNFERYRLRPFARPELEAMTIVARWLRERDPADGKLLYLNGPQADAAAIARALLEPSTPPVAPIHPKKKSAESNAHAAPLSLMQTPT